MTTSQQESYETLQRAMRVAGVRDEFGNGIINLTVEDAQQLVGAIDELDGDNDTLLEKISEFRKAIEPLNRELQFSPNARIALAQLNTAVKRYLS